MRSTRPLRLLIAAGVTVGVAAAAGALSASAGATDAPPGYPGTPETLDWPKGGTVRPVPPPPTMGPKDEGPLPSWPRP
jgi:hypothetical protein